MGNRIDRYITGLFWFYFLGGLIVFITIFVAIDSLGMMVSHKGVEAHSLIQYYLFSIPEVIYRMSPMASLLGTIFTLSTLNRNNELVALYSAGVSLFRIMTPVIMSVVLIAVGIFALSDRVMPRFAKEKNFVFYNDIEKNPSLYSMVKNEKIWYRSKDSIFYIKTLNENNHEAQGLTLYYFNQVWDLIQMVTADRVQMVGSNWNLFNGSVTLFTEESSFPLTSQFKKKTIVMSEDARDLGSTSRTSDVLSLAELSSFIKKNKEAGLDTVQYEVDYHSKYGFAFAAIVMSLVGIPFSVRRARSGGVMLNIGICLGLIFAYWIIYSSALTLGNYGQIPPLIAAWFPNLAMGGLAYVMIRRK